jgi:protein-L-isoaspartate(D-aspartate) O-methyltransferase
MNFQTARHNMVESQIRTNQVTDERILAAMDSLPRELFVPDALKGVAYGDGDLDLGQGRTLPAPMVLARLLQAAEVRPTDLALVVAAGTGYSAAVLSKLAGSVVAVESEAALLQRAGKLLGQLGIDSVALVEGKIADGYPKEAPYNVILVDGALADVPVALTSQLAEGGRLVAMVGAGRIATGTLVSRFGGHVARRGLFEAGATSLREFLPKPSFSF